MNPQLPAATAAKPAFSKTPEIIGPKQPELKLVEPTDLQKLVGSYVNSIDRMLAMNEFGAVKYEGVNYSIDQVCKSHLGSFRSRHDYMQRVLATEGEESQQYVRDNYFGSGLSEIIMGILDDPSVENLKLAKQQLETVSPV